MNESQQSQVVVVVAGPKSMGLAGALAFFFGPLGMIYSTPMGAIVMFLVSIVVALLTFGFGLILTWPLCIVWSMVAVNGYNSKLKAVTS